MSFSETGGSWTARSGQMARFGGMLFVAAAATIVVGVLVPHQPEFQVAPMLVVAAASACAGAVLLAGGDRLPMWVLYAAPFLASLLASCSLLFNGERLGGDPQLNELYYLWVVLWTAYFLPRMATFLNAVAILVAYAFILGALDAGDTGFNRWVSTAGIVIGSSLVVRLLSERVQQLVGELQTAARTDPLTGLFNRRHFEEQAGVELARARREGTPLALLLIDVDRLKELNDRSGHASGDVALRAVADVLRERLRATDTAARIGGDEFALLLPGSGEDAAREIAARLEEDIEAAGAEIGLSAGAAAHGRDGETIEVLMRVADERLYGAKRARRGPIGTRSGSNGR